MEKILEVVKLNKFYKKHHVLKDIDLTIYKKEIVGFIGPNGAGKSTTMKCINNLLYPDSGTIKICGYDILKEREKALSCQASLIENPGLYPGMSGLDNLKIFAKLRKVSTQRLQEIIEFTALRDSLKNKVQEYSLGMKQRLALGIVLLGKPHLIILDEPINGLDPKGVMELRESLLQLVQKEDTSILFSSHILGEIEKIATRIICINNGKIIEPEQFHISERYSIVTNDNNKSVCILKDVADALQTTITKDKITFTVSSTLPLKSIIRILVHHNIDILDIEKEDIDMEAVYRSIYGD